MRVIKYIAVHCTAGNQKESIADLIAGFRANGWKANGYHAVVDAEGVIHTITPDEEIANGVQGFNEVTLHISYLGGIDKAGKPVDNRTDKQKAAIIVKLKEWKAKYPKAKIQGHRDFSPDTNHNGKVDKFEWVKVCPCFDAIPEYAGI